jgi:hypothetical protein
MAAYLGWSAGAFFAAAAFLGLATFAAFGVAGAGAGAAASAIFDEFVESFSECEQVERRN